MSGSVKFLIGLVVAVFLGWIWHGPAGQGEKLAAGIHADARSLVAQAKLPGISVSRESGPLSRNLIVSGTANDLQREGLGSGFGIKDYARATPRVGKVRWDDEPAAFSLPLIAETLAVTALLYLLGFAAGALLFNRRQRHSFLD